MLKGQDIGFCRGLYREHKFCNPTRFIVQDANGKFILIGVGI